MKGSTKVTISIVIAVLLVLISSAYGLMKVIKLQSEMIIGNLLPEDINTYSFITLDYKKTYDLYFNVTNPKENITILEESQYIKVEDDYIYWNVDNEWIKDRQIDEKIKFLHMNEEYFIVLTASNKLYKITYEDYVAFDGFITNEVYNDFSYIEININEQIEFIEPKLLPMDCEYMYVYYIKTLNKLYYIDYNNKLIEVTNKIYKNFTELNYSCNTVEGEILNILNDGSIQELNNKDIKVKYHVYLEKKDKYYNLIIDQNDYLYVIDKTIDNITPLTKIEQYSYKNELDKEELYIKLNKKEAININK